MSNTYLEFQPKNIDCSFCNTRLTHIRSASNKVFRSSQVVVEMECPKCLSKVIEYWTFLYSHANYVKPKRVLKPTTSMLKVESSVIDSIGYDVRETCLYIKFKSGDKLYGYKGVDAHTATEFLFAPSKGRYYSEYIRGQYPTLH